jgi:TrmH family RNA methyltransferase
MNPHMFRQLTSTTNTEIKSVVDLHDARGRKKEKKFIAEGLRTISTLMQGGMQLHMVYVTQEMLDDAQKLAHAQYICLVNNAIMAKISTAISPSGMVAVFTIPTEKSWQTMSSGIVLARIADPGNMGTLIRSAAAMNIKTVVVIEGADVWSPKVVQATAGTLAYVHIFTMKWEELMTHKRKLKLCALVVDGGKKPTEISFKNSLLVVGSEAHGIPHDWISQCNSKMTIPMQGQAESLNAAVAGSIALYIGFVQDLS